MATTAMKVCTVCHRDCADLPRVKDEFGRYTCRACLDSNLNGAAEAARVNARDNDGLDLRAAAMLEAKAQVLDLPETQSCPKCHGFLPEAARLCMRCGYDRKRGSKVMTRVERVKQTKEKLRPGQSPMLAVLACWLIGAIPVVMMALGFFGPVYKTLGVEVAMGAALLSFAITCGTLLMVTVFQFVDGYSGYGFGTIGAFVCLIGMAVSLVSGIALGATALLLALVFAVMALVLFIRTVIWAMSMTERDWLRTLGTCYGIYVLLAVVQGVMVGAHAIDTPWPAGWTDGDQGVSEASAAAAQRGR